MSLILNDKYLSDFIKPNDYEAISKEIKFAHNTLHSFSGEGSEFTGWLNLPSNCDKDELKRIKVAAEKIKSDTDIFVIIGIGGSYLGAKAAIDFLKSPNYNLIKKDGPSIFFVGNNISSDYISEILALCENKDVSLNVISKSGTTTEPAISFRIFKEFMENKYGDKGAAERIYCTTDNSRGALKKLSQEKGYETFIIPDNIGGRFSVLTAVGLLPIAVSGGDIDSLLEGALCAQKELDNDNIYLNSCYKYAAIRNILYRKGKVIEILGAYEPRLLGFLEWWKQLFGESEGKGHKGIFPSSALFSSDLHSMGQFIQDGSRLMFETVILIDKPMNDIILKNDCRNADNLNFISGKKISYINKKAFEGTIIAHTDGGTPNIVINIDEVSEYNLGYLIYFFEKACALSGYILGVNPFNQPGVESYKKNMFALLGKPGYESEREVLEKRIK